MSKEAMKLALEALERMTQPVKTNDETQKYKAVTKAITALREALAEQPAQQEQNRQIDQLIQERDHRDEIIDKLCDAVLGPDRYEWSSQYFFEDAVREVEERMAEQPAQQEPVAWVCEGSEPDEKHGIDYWPGDVDDLPIGTQLYTSPQRTWVGLTDEEITDIWAESSPYYHEDDFARAIEAKLRSKNEDRN